MKICRSCGAQLNDDVKFCTHCGADTTADGAAERAQQYAAPENQGNAYYQPGNDYSANNYNGGQYQSPSYQQPIMNGQPIKKKKKLPAWAIVLIVLACLGVLFFIGIMALGFWGMRLGMSYLEENPGILDDLDGYYEDGDSYDYDYDIESGIVNGTTYVNDKFDIAIDITGSDYRFLDGAELAEYIGSDTLAYTEAFLSDDSTGENILVMQMEGSFLEATQDIDKFVRETVEYAFGSSTDEYDISETYTLTIAGETYTCIDVSQTIDDGYGTESYQLEQTLCFIREGKTFFEIQFTLYPDITGTTPQSLIDAYFHEAD